MTALALLRRGFIAEGGHAEQHQEQHADEEDERRPVLGARLSGVGLAGGDDVVGVIRIRAAVRVLQRDGAEFLARELLLDDESLAVGRGGGQVRVIERLLGRGIVHGDGGEVFYLHVVREGEDDEERRSCDGAEDHA